MDEIEVLFFINQMRHRELIQQAEQEPLIDLICKNRLGDLSTVWKIIEWSREHQVENFKKEKYPREQGCSSKICEI